MDVVAPFHGRIQALWSIEVVIAGSDVDADGVEFSECLPQEGGGIGRYAVVLVEIAAAEERIGVDFAREIHDG